MRFTYWTALIAFFVFAILVTRRHYIGDRRWEWAIPPCDAHCDHGSKWPIDK